MNWLTRLTLRDYSKAQRISAMLLGQILFWIGFPLFIVVGAFCTDRRLHLPRFDYGLANLIIGLLLIIPGGLLAEWAVKVQFSLGEGTPIPFIATRKLIVERPYTYCRNPMASGTSMVYLGVAIWVGSVAAVGLALIYPTFIVAYTKLVEERELEKRFGAEYIEYKRKTPFLLPRLRRKA
jgi:protein-S-isoprenylcysteine O-methyltransferase Ste14